MRLLFAVFLGLALAQFKNDRLLAHFENSAVKEPGSKRIVLRDAPEEFFTLLSRPRSSLA